MDLQLVPADLSPRVAQSHSPPAPCLHYIAAMRGSVPRLYYEAMKLFCEGYPTEDETSPHIGVLASNLDLFKCPFIMASDDKHSRFIDPVCVLRDLGIDDRTSHNASCVIHAVLTANLATMLYDILDVEIGEPRLEVLDVWLDNFPHYFFVPRSEYDGGPVDPSSTQPSFRSHLNAMFEFVVEIWTQSVVDDVVGRDSVVHLPTACHSVAQILCGNGLLGAALLDILDKLPPSPSDDATPLGLLVPSTARSGACNDQLKISPSQQAYHTRRVLSVLRSLKERRSLEKCFDRAKFLLDFRRFIRRCLKSFIDDHPFSDPTVSPEASRVGSHISVPSSNTRGHSMESNQVGRDRVSTAEYPNRLPPRPSTTCGTHDSSVAVKREEASSFLSTPTTSPSSSVVRVAKSVGTGPGSDVAVLTSPYGPRSPVSANLHKDDGVLGRPYHNSTSWPSKSQPGGLSCGHPSSSSPSSHTPSPSRYSGSDISRIAVGCPIYHLTLCFFIILIVCL